MAWADGPYAAAAQGPSRAWQASSDTPPSSPSCTDWAERSFQHAPAHSCRDGIQGASARPWGA
eukprot:5642089-Pyramimonas_sp.AAC.1